RFSAEAMCCPRFSRKFRMGKAGAKPSLVIPGRAKREPIGAPRNDEREALTRIRIDPILFRRDDRTCLARGSLRPPRAKPGGLLRFSNLRTPGAPATKANRPSAFANGRLVSPQDLWGAYA